MASTPLPKPAPALGTVALSAAQTRLLYALDDVFTGWAAAVGAEQLVLPPLLPADAMRKLDFFVNFPHLALVVSQVRGDDGTRERLADRTKQDALCAHELEPTGLVLPTAACFAVYLHLSGTVVSAPPYRVTVRERCFRNEEYYDGLKRVLGFHMREIVCVGDLGTAQSHLEAFTPLVEALGGVLGLSLQREVGLDPFFDKDGSRAQMQQLFPVKQEFLVDGLAIASVNLHRNFFGERCEIGLPDGGPAFTSCVAFGLERWVYALEQRFGGDIEAAISALRDAARTIVPDV